MSSHRLTENNGTNSTTAILNQSTRSLQRPAVSGENLSEEWISTEPYNHEGGRRSESMTSEQSTGIPPRSIDGVIACPPFAFEKFNTRFTKRCSRDEIVIVENVEEKSRWHYTRLEVAVLKSRRIERRP